MNESFTIGEVAQLLNVPTATLRFWEEKGLFSIGKSSNRYRRYTGRDLVQIADVIFHRNLGIPVRQVHQMETCTLEQYAHQLEMLQTQLASRIREHQHMYQRTQNQSCHLAEIQRLMHCSFVEEDIPFDAVSTFDYNEKDKLIRYAQNPSCYVRYFDTQDMRTETRGIIALPEYGDHSLLWKKTPDAKFCTFLIREKADQDYESDVLQSLAKIQQHYKTGHLLAQYLLTAEENGERIDYLKAYLEAAPLS